MRRLLICSVFAIGLVHAGSAAANSSKLKGVYAFTGSAACLVSAPSSTSAGGFDAVTLQPLPGSRVWSTSFGVEGVRIFNGDGTGTVKGTSVGFTPPPTPSGCPPMTPGCFPPGAGSQNFTASFTYTVNPDGMDGTFTTQLPNGLAGTQATGPGVGETFLITNFPELTGLIGDNAKTLTLANLAPTVETITNQNGSVQYRICHRSRVLVKIKDDPIQQ
jgi:hypothetical protein